MTLNQIVNELKSSGHFFAAGALACEMGAPCNYGCHVGMRSTLDYAREQFRKGYDAAQRRN